MEPMACTRHPDTETYLRCSACETPICPDCWVEAAVGYQCPSCAGSRGAAVADREDGRPSLLGGLSRPGGATPRPEASGERLPPTLGARAGAVGLVAAVVGGMLLGPVLTQGTFFLLTSGAIGWAVARATFWAAGEASTPFVRAIAMTFAGFTAAVGMVTADASSSQAGLIVLAYPAAFYGGWIVVRRR